MKESRLPIVHPNQITSWKAQLEEEEVELRAKPFPTRWLGSGDADATALPRKALHANAAIIVLPAAYRGRNTLGRARTRRAGQAGAALRYLHLLRCQLGVL